ncbi:hypothetical protein LNN31_13550 [Acetobacterium wieringae]|uniref:DUF2577 domain-containing protein n=1 Tax=Acetobacterium wieringae TaxID=52694 RepID=A0ABY6HDW4_9FIRM|nr:hypothetical protein [Acetobacterium wieringae]UYO61801.1 hypothetical protein LNN31_13550 [Acetobacterium wieringae]
MLDKLIKTIVKNEIAEVNTTMRCTVITVSPLVIQPIPKKNYLTGEEDYPLIVSVKKLKQWALVNGTPTPFILPLNVGDTVLVAFGKKDLSDAVILGVIG